jgi:hypothetical protein
MGRWQKLLKTLGASRPELTEAAKAIEQRMHGLADDSQLYKAAHDGSVKASEEAASLWKDLPIDVKNKIAEHSPEDHQVMDAIYNKYFDYGVPENHLSPLLPDNEHSDFIQKLKGGAMGAAGIGALGAAAGSGDDASAGPLSKARLLADEYAKYKGLGKLVHTAPDAAVNVERAKKIAEAYEALQHNPFDPKVQQAYNSLIHETGDQLALLKDAGLKTSKITPDMGNPYKNSKAMIQDVADNNHLYYYPTEQGFGTNVGSGADHPLLQPVKVGNETMPANDAFRIVHDYFGHAKEGSGFGPKGEENAWREHMQMFTPEAQKALTTETRGQNSWVNYGPHGELNQANPANTVYADQKAGLLPEWARKLDPKALAALTAGGGLAGYGEKGYTAPTEQEVSPLPALEDMLTKYRKGVGKAADWTADKVLETTTPMIPGRDKFIQEQKPIVSGGLEMVGDPTNYVPGVPEALMAHDFLKSEDPNEETNH